MIMNLPTPNQMTFLIVDDMDNMRRSIRAMLKLIGYGQTIIEAGDGRKAWDTLDQKGEPVHFIISDWNMPKMNGLELLKAVRADEKYKDIPFLMITAENRKENVVDAIQAGTSEFIAKPFTDGTLREKLKKIIK